MRRLRKCVAALALLTMGLLLVGCSVPGVRRADVVGLWTHPGDPSQSVEIRSDGTFLIRNVSLGALNGGEPDHAAAYRQGGTWTLERFYESPHRYFLSLTGVSDEERTFIYTLRIVGSGSNASMYLALGGRFEGRRFEFERSRPETIGPKK